MDYKHWLDTLATAVQDWRKSQAVTVHSEKIEPPASAELIQQAELELTVALPADLIAFYREGSAACHVEFTIELPSHLELRCDRCYTTRLAGGFGLVPLNEIVGIRKGFCELLESIPVPDPSKFKTFLEFGIPIWVTRGDDFVVYVNSNDPAESGIYFFYFGELAEPEWNVRYADSLTEWLQFLESSCYAGPEANDVLYWHQGRKLVPNEVLRQQVLQAIALDQPREAPSMEELIARIRANELKRALE